MPPRHCFVLLVNVLAALAVPSDAFVTATATLGRRTASAADAPGSISAVYGATPPEGDGDDMDDIARPSLDDGAYGPFGETAMIVALGSITLVMSAALFNLATDPRSELDVDLYLSITRSLNGLGGASAGGASAGVGMGSGDNDGYGVGGIAGERVELRLVGPSEQIVGAFFGTPQN